jgi:glycosyltransferase involved in cell wall biosynthesis
MDKKLKILMLGDHPLSPSGVGTQIKYIIDHLYKTGKYEFICLGGAVKHQDYRPQKIDIYGDDVMIFPVDGYGNPDIIRSLLRTQKPDILWFMTDPRFYEWLWDIEDEVRANVPMIYYHVWDNYPYPKFNLPYYNSNDIIVTISKLTDDIVKTVSPSVERVYIPHSVDLQIFRKLPEDETRKFKAENFGDKFTVFWNSRNAKRKMSGSVIFWFKEFLDIVGKDKANLIMHTDPKDPNGQDLEAIIHELELTNGEVRFSINHGPAHELATLYNIADVTVNISDAEGFGLSVMESLACETPCIVNMTGGLQEQITDGKNFFGVGIEPTSKAIIGSQQVPFIYEDRITGKDFIDALKKMFDLSKEERRELGRLGREHIQTNYNPDDLLPQWDELLQTTYKEKGSWETRNYKRWSLKKIG